MSKATISGSFESFLLTAGFSSRVIKKSNLDTRLYHDLGLYGDTASWFIDELAKKVDMTGFKFTHYFPPEFYGENVLSRLFFGFCPFASWVRRNVESYTPITLGMILLSLEKGKWIGST